MDLFGNLSKVFPNESIVAQKPKERGTEVHRSPPILGVTQTSTDCAEYRSVRRSF
jgi:hypothetical protein